VCDEPEAVVTTFYTNLYQFNLMKIRNESIQKKKFMNANMIKLIEMW